MEDSKLGEHLFDLDRFGADAAATVLAELADPSATKRNEALRMTGLEPVLLWIATKVALPIATGLVSRTLYDLYKVIRTPQDAKIAMQALAKQPQDNGEAVAPEILLQDAEIALQEEGLNQFQARRVAEKLLNNYKDTPFAKKPARE